MSDFTPLDNPIWHALTTTHQSMARVAGLARRYPSDVSPLVGLFRPTPAALLDLRTLVKADESVVLFTFEALEVPNTWQVIGNRAIEQMVCSESDQSSTFPPLDLKSADVPEMLALTAATQPGPFLPSTIQMGRYLGIRSNDGALVAMAGERLKLSDFTEISAVCTHPAFRGRGNARALVSSLACYAVREGKTPFLHVTQENSAKLLYEKVGFTVRCAMQLTMIAPR
jgi:predicted GNAT family acetyltransferase